MRISFLTLAAFFKNLPGPKRLRCLSAFLAKIHFRFKVVSGNDEIINMIVNMQIDGKSGVIEVRDNLDTQLVGDLLTKAFDEAFNKGVTDIVFDVSKVNLINSFGIGRMLSCVRKAKEKNKQIVLRQPQGFLKETFELLHLQKLFILEN